MPNYRLYFHNAAGHFIRAENVNVASDKTALARARAIEHTHCIEVWCGKRMIGIVNPDVDPDAAAKL